MQHSTHKLADFIPRAANEWEYANVVENRGSTHAENLRKPALCCLHGEIHDHCRTVSSFHPPHDRLRKTRIVCHILRSLQIYQEINHKTTPSFSSLNPSPSPFPYHPYLPYSSSNPLFLLRLSLRTRRLSHLCWAIPHASSCTKSVFMCMMYL